MISIITHTILVMLDNILIVPEHKFDSIILDLIEPEKIAIISHKTWKCKKRYFVFKNDLVISFENLIKIM